MSFGGAHILQGIEICNGRPILYDTGDLVDDYAVDPRLRNDYGLLDRLDVEGSTVQHIELVPTRIENCQVNLATNSDRAATSARMQQLCAEMGTGLHVKDKTLSIECVEPIEA